MPFEEKLLVFITSCIHEILFFQCSFNDFMACRFAMILCHIFIYEFLIATQAMVRLFHIIIINTLNIKKASLNMNFLGKIKVKPTGNINIGNDIAYADVDSFKRKLVL